MDKNETMNLVNALKEGVVTVTFEKIGTDEIRIMPCTIMVSPLPSRKSMLIQIISQRGQLTRKPGDPLDLRR